jgi:hypothetical protein
VAVSIKQWRDPAQQRLARSAIPALARTRKVNCSYAAAREMRGSKQFVWQSRKRAGGTRHTRAAEFDPAE